MPFHQPGCGAPSALFGPTEMGAPHPTRDERCLVALGLRCASLRATSFALNCALELLTGDRHAKRQVVSDKLIGNLDDHIRWPGLIKDRLGVPQYTMQQKKTLT